LVIVNIDVVNLMIIIHLDESLIKLKIDNLHNQAIKKVQLEKEKEEKEKEMRKSNEYAYYLELKKKYE
jgi:hypothetical protein